MKAHFSSNLEPPTPAMAKSHNVLQACSMAMFAKDIQQQCLPISEATFAKARDVFKLARKNPELSFQV